MYFCPVWAEILRQAWRNLTAHRRRAVLTLLSISIGIFSVSAVQVFTYSMELSIVDRFERYGVSVVYVHHFPWKFDGGEDWQKYARRPRMTLRELEGLRQGLQGEAWAALFYSVSEQTFRYGKERQTTRVSGISEDGVYTAGVEVREGRFFRPEELRRASLLAVVGSQFARSFFGKESAVGKVIWWEGRPLQVIGVLKAQGTFGNDRIVYVPLPLLLRLYPLNRYGGRGDPTILVKAKRPEILGIDELEQRVRLSMRQVRRLPPRAEDNFTINRQDALLSQVKSIVAYVQVVGLFIAGFALVVGGTGVANILYVSVRERQGEIGIQRAMGAPRAFILGLFLTEGAYLSLIGGGLGIALTLALMGVARPFLLEEGFILGWSVGQVLKAVGLSLGLGILAALAPAYQAARLQPIDAIRST